jgi:LemA protein
MVVVIAAVVVVLLVVFGVLTFNKLVAKRNSVHEAWAGVDVQLTRRADLVPNLVATVQGYQVHERETLEAVVDARNLLGAAGGPPASRDADRQLEGSIRQLFALSERYPDLKASTNFLSLQAELSKVEEDIAFARRFYNATVRKYNDARQSFPAVLAAGPLGFRDEAYFRAEADAAQAPRVGA